jgi:hypothetical protein
LDLIDVPLGEYFVDVLLEHELLARIQIIPLLVMIAYLSLYLTSLELGSVDVPLQVSDLLLVLAALVEAGHSTGNLHLVLEAVNLALKQVDVPLDLCELLSTLSCRRVLFINLNV